MKIKKISKSYVKNLNPIFFPPKNDKPRPAFIQYSIKQTDFIDVTKTGLEYFVIATNLKQKNGFFKRKRKLNKYRASAMRVMVKAMLYHYNIVSKLVQASIEQLADECGLSTRSKSGNKSITRVSRLINEFMEPMGLIKCEKNWDRILGYYMPKLMSLTPLFFLMLNITIDKLENARYQRLGWINKNLLKRGKKPISLEQASQRYKDNQIREMIKYRMNKHNFNLKKRKIKKLFLLSEDEIKQKILRKLIKRYSLFDLRKMGFSGLKKQVNMEYFYLKKMAFFIKKN